MSYLSDHQRVHSFFVNEFGNLVNNQSVPVTLEPEEVTEQYEEVMSDFGVNFI
jgi:hypothetical protein